MALIRVECGGCQTALQVRGELAGQQGKCPVCGAVIAIPAASDGSPSSSATIAPPIAAAAQVAGAARAAVPASGAPAAVASPATGGPPPSAPAVSASAPLFQVGIPDMLVEVQRRKKSAVMIVFETPPPGESYEISKRPEANVRCYRTGDMNEAQVMQVLEQLGHMSKGMQNQKGGIGLQPEGAPLPYELKGDRLGMTLEEFKAKYARNAGGVVMPFCADSCAGQAIAALNSEAWHVGAGLVNARVDLPSENSSPTIAGVKTEQFLYHFVDGRLYRMTVHFDTEAFHLIHAALVQKQGPAVKENKERGELWWENGVSTIHLIRGAMYPKKASRLIYFHNQLQKSAEGRAPKRETDL
jgi:hypothetical protein